MKKQYSKPHTEVVAFSLESFIAASNLVIGTEGLDDVTAGTDKPSDFSKVNHDLWDFEDEN